MIHDVPYIDRVTSRHQNSVRKLYVYIMSQRRTYESGNIPELQCIPSLFRYMIGRITDHPSQHETRATHILSE